MVELLICNQRVGGSNPSVGSNLFNNLQNRLIIKITFSPTIFPLFHFSLSTLFQKCLDIAPSKSDNPFKSLEKKSHVWTKGKKSSSTKTPGSRNNWQPHRKKNRCP